MLIDVHYRGMRGLVFQGSLRAAGNYRPMERYAVVLELDHGIVVVRLDGMGIYRAVEHFHLSMVRGCRNFVSRCWIPCCVHV